MIGDDAIDMAPSQTGNTMHQTTLMMISRRGTRARSYLVAVALGVLAACSGLPAAGPSAASFTAAPDVAREFAVVDLSARVVAVLAQRPQPSLPQQLARAAVPSSRTIGRGDQLEITLWEAASGGLFSAAGDTMRGGSPQVTLPLQTVDADGLISVPYAGQIPAAGRSERDIEQAIVAALANKAIEPQALVAVRENQSNSIAIMGEGVSGARIALPAPQTRLLDVLALAGGVALPPHQARITLTRGDISASFMLSAILQVPADNIVMQAGDHLLVERDNPSLTVLGATGQNAVIALDDPQLTLEKALAKAGGLSLANADPAGVFVLRREPVALAQVLAPSHAPAVGASAVNVVYRINLAAPETLFLARQFVMQPDDIIYAAGAAGNNLERFLRLVGLSLGTARSVATGL